MKTMLKLFTFRNIILIIINLLIIRTCAILYYSMPIAYNTNDTGIINIAIFINFISILVNMIVINALILLIRENPSPVVPAYNNQHI